jgi:hypothetical protein
MRWCSADPSGGTTRAIPGRPALPFQGANQQPVERRRSTGLPRELAHPQSPRNLAFRRRTAECAPDPGPRASQSLTGEKAARVPLGVPPRGDQALPRDALSLPSRLIIPQSPNRSRDGPSLARAQPKSRVPTKRPRRRVLPADRSVGDSLAAPLGGIRQHEQVRTGDQEQRKREQQAYPGGILPLYYRDELTMTATVKVMGSQRCICRAHLFQFMVASVSVVSTSFCDTSIHEF